MLQRKTATCFLGDGKVRAIGWLDIADKVSVEPNVERESRMEQSRIAFLEQHIAECEALIEEIDAEPPDPELQLVRVGMRETIAKSRRELIKLNNRQPEGDGKSPKCLLRRSSEASRK
jgi:hypothetical protein